MRLQAQGHQRQQHAQFCTKSLTFIKILPSWSLARCCCGQCPQSANAATGQACLASRQSDHPHWWLGGLPPLCASVSPSLRTAAPALAPLPPPSPAHDIDIGRYTRYFDCALKLSWICKADHASSCTPFDLQTKCPGQCMSKLHPAAYRGCELLADL